MATPFNSNLPLSTIKQEQHSHNSPSPMHHHSPSPSPPPNGESLEPNEPEFLKSIHELGNLSSFINEFQRRFDELKTHLDFIRTAIDANEQKQPNQTQTTPLIAPPTIEAATTEVKTSVAPPKSELISLCEMMCGKGLRKYLISNLSNSRELRVEVPSALQCAPDPAKLVLECIGRFYLQGSRAFAKNSPMIPGRKASILILELFMLVIDNEVELVSSVKQEAEQAALAWRKRLKAEGGINKACESDAKGLLLFVGCFGIPNVFSNDDVWQLVRSSNPKQIMDALRRSRVLVSRISDILERMMSNGIKIEAVDVAYAFGIEDKFPPQKILSSYLRDSKEALKRRKRDASNSPTLLKEASEKQLASLKSVLKFLEDRKLDPVKLLSGLQIREKIGTLEKEIADLSKKIDERAAAKRKANENELLNNLKNQEAKRLRFAGSPHVTSPSLGLHDHRAPYHVDGNGLYGASIRLNLPDGGFSGHINNPLATSMIHGSSPFSAAAYGSVPSTSSSYPGGRSELLVDGTGQKLGSRGLPYGWHGVGDASVIDGSVRQSILYHPASGLNRPSTGVVEGFARLPNSPPTAANRTSNSDLYRFADTVK
ncbi:Protein FRIGIDA [Euphorbia peplus]|nr:Protein FRIGIDA [Euphorbia peplus]